MQIEMRTYSLVPGGAAEYLKLYNAMGRQVQTAILGQLVGVYQSEVGELNQVIFVWAFDSLDERQRRRRELMADAGFTEFRKASRHLLLKQENRLLTAV
jgi:aspartate/tyrosine/aromatic aminotransferase